MPRFLAMILLPLISLAPSAQTQSSPASEKQFTREVRLTSRQLERLRPVVKKDLAELLKTVTNDTPTAADVEDEFLHSQFTPMNLGALGPAILLEARAGHGASNAALLTIYVPDKNSYRRIVKTAGFGPEFDKATSTIPDLIFGWASGVCHTTYQHYRFKAGEYRIDACDQEADAEKGDTCVVKSCENSSLPTFPDPGLEAEAKDESNTPPPPSPYFTGASRSGEEILHASQTGTSSK